MNTHAHFNETFLQVFVPANTIQPTNFPKSLEFPLQSSFPEPMLKKKKNLGRAVPQHQGGSDRWIPGTYHLASLARASPMPMRDPSQESKVEGAKPKVVL